MGWTPYTFQDFCSLADALVEHRQPDSPSFLFNLQKGILDHFFGMQWLDTFGALEGHKRSYLRPTLDGAGEATDFSMRLLNLAEMLYNIQTAPGVRNPLQDISSGQIEPGLAELQAGMLLMRNARPFRYLERAPGRQTHDLEIECGGRLWPAEVKCKIDGTDLSEAAIISALRKARDQLPPDETGSGVVIVRCPRAWATDRSGPVVMPPQTITAVNNYLRNSRRIGLVVFYVFQYERRVDDFLVTNAVREVPSHRHPSLDWWDHPLFPMDDRGNWETWPMLVDSWKNSRGRGVPKS
jgi:hypothetical protein